MRGAGWALIVAELAFVLTLVNPAAALETGSWAAQDESGPEAAVSDVAADFADGADGPAAPGAGGMLVKGGSVAARNGVMQGAARGMQIAGRFLGGTDDVVRFIDDIGRAATNAWRSVGDDMMRLQADDAATFLPSKLAPKGGVGGGAKLRSPGGVEFVDDAGSRLIRTPSGRNFDMPDGWNVRVTDNGRGLIAQVPGSTGPANSLRVMDDGYFRMGNQHGQYIDPGTGRFGPRSATHPSWDYQGPLPRWYG
jgi:hypothetical protein